MWHGRDRQLVHGFNGLGMLGERTFCIANIFSEHARFVAQCPILGEKALGRPSVSVAGVPCDIDEASSFLGGPVIFRKCDDARINGFDFDNALISNARLASKVLTRPLKIGGRWIDPYNMLGRHRYRIERLLSLCLGPRFVCGPTEYIERGCWFE